MKKSVSKKPLPTNEAGVPLGPVGGSGKNRRRLPICWGSTVDQVAESAELIANIRGQIAVLQSAVAGFEVYEPSTDDDMKIGLQDTLGHLLKQAQALDKIIRAVHSQRINEGTDPYALGGAQ